MRISDWSSDVCSSDLDDFDPATRDRFFAGLMLPTDWLVQAHRFRAWYRARVAEVFREVDIILAPATPCVAPKIGQVMMTLNGVEMPVRANLGLFTQPISAIGLPVVAAPWADRGQDHGGPRPTGVHSGRAWGGERGGQNG